MKLTKKELIDLIKEAIYFPPGMTQSDIEYGNELRKMLSPEDIAKANELVRSFPNDPTGYMLGGVPEEKPELPMKTFDIENDQDLRNSPLNRGRGMKELVMNVDDEIYEYIANNGSKRVDEEGEVTYSLPLFSVYQEMRKYKIPKDLVDEVIEHYTYYGYEIHAVNMGGRNVDFISVIDQ